MKNSSYFKIASTLLALSVFAGCASLPIQQNEFDDVYFTSADRTQPRKVVVNPQNTSDLSEDVVTLERKSIEKVDDDIILKYNNGAPAEVVYFEESDPRVRRASELNYRDFIADYNDNLLQNYDLPLDWEDMDAVTFDRIVRDDFQFRNAWYQQYYQGNTSAMDAYARNTNNNNGISRNINYNFNLGFGFGSFYSPFNRSFFWGDPFYSGFYDPFWSFGYSYRPFGISRWSRWGWGLGYDPFFDPFFYSGWNSYAGFGWRRTSWLWGRNVIIADNNYYRNNNDYTRGGRLRSTSIASVRSDANRGTARTRSTVSNADGPRTTRSTISTGRVSNNSVRSSSTVRSSRTSVDEALARSSRRVSTDAYRFDNRTRTNTSTYRTSSSRSAVASRLGYSSPRSGRSSYTIPSTNRSSIPSYTRSSNSRSSTGSSGVSFNRSSSSRSSSPVFSRGSSSSSRSSGGVRSSSSSSSRSSGSSVRSSSSSGGSRSSGSSRSSGGSSSSSRSSSSGSSRSGRGN